MDKPNGNGKRPAMPIKGKPGKQAVRDKKAARTAQKQERKHAFKMERKHK
jgi:hypothetical protein